MPISNITVFMPSVLTLIGIPGLESVQCWIGIPFCAIYFIAMIGNSMLLIIIKSERSLHEPMYIFVGMLGVTDIALATTIMPKMLGIFWFHCRFQFYHTTIISHSYCEHMAIVKLAAENVRVNKIYGLFVALTVAGFDLTFITLSYIQIFITVFHLPQKKARWKAFNTCIAHIGVFLQFYLLAFFSFFTHRFGAHVPPYIHILFSSLYLLVPPFLNPLVYGAKTKQIRIH
ncbi:hypothetical protein GH733_001500, partial [Mirounga leonina]